MDIAKRKRSYPPTWRIVAAFLIVPGVSALAMAIIMPAYDGISDQVERIWRSALVFAVVGAYPATLILGLPAFFMLRRRFEATLLNCSLTGAIVAALPWFLLSLLSTPDNASIGGRATVLHGSLTPYGWFTNVTSISQIALFGAAGGLLFWFVAVAGWRTGRVH